MFGYRGSEGGGYLRVGCILLRWRAGIGLKWRNNVGIITWSEDSHTSFGQG